LEDERQEEIRADDVHQKTDSAIVASPKHSKRCMLVHVFKAQDQSSSKAFDAMLACAS